MAISEDRRVRKTKKLMTEALASLLAEKPLKNISVREIADLADINRGTFYLHYRDVYDMVETVQNEIFEQFHEIVDAYQPKKNGETPFPMLVELFDLLAENADLAKYLIGKNGDAAFVDKLKGVVKEKCFAEVQKTFKIKNKDDSNYFYQYIVSGCIGIFGEWLSKGMKETPAEMAALVENIILKGVMAFA